MKHFLKYKINAFVHKMSDKCRKMCFVIFQNKILTHQRIIHFLANYTTKY